MVWMGGRFHPWQRRNPMNQPLAPQPGASRPLRDVVMQFGFPIEKFALGMGRKKAGRIGGLLLVAAGIGIVIWTIAAGLNPMMALPGAALVLAGVGLIVVTRRIGSLAVLVCPRGLVVAKPGQVETCTWDQITEVQESGAGSRFIIERADGTRLTFTSETVPRIGRFGQLLRPEIERRKIPWKKKQTG